MCTTNKFNIQKTMLSFSKQLLSEQDVNNLSIHIHVRDFI